jgi:hypothetical protein
MQNELPSLITADAQTGLALAGRLAHQLHAQVDAANARIKQPGGMNYLMRPALPEEATVSLLFYTIAAANRGWPAKVGGTSEA